MNATIQKKLEAIELRLNDYCNSAMTLDSVFESIPDTPPLEDIQEIRDRLNASANRLHAEADHLREVLEMPKLAMTYEEAAAKLLGEPKPQAVKPPAKERLTMRGRTKQNPPGKRTK